MIPIINELPMKCFRVKIGEKTFDVFTPDVNDVSSIVNVTDEFGDQVPFSEWNQLGEIIQTQS